MCAAPSLLVLQAINHQFEFMSIAVAVMPGKGLGLVAQADIAEGELVAYYLTKLFSRCSHRTVSTYSMCSGLSGHILDIFDGSFRSPDDDGIPYVAPLVNEPTGVDGEENCDMWPVPLPDEDGSIRRHGLYTTKPVVRGEELVWDYGPAYGPRPYPSKHNK